MRRAVLVLALISCNGGSHDATDAPPAVTCPANTGGLPVEQFEHAYEVAYCDYMVRCGLVSDEATCMSASLAPPLVDHLEDAIAGVGAGRVCYDAAAAQSCIDQVAGRSCQINDALLQGPRAAACTYEVFSGKSKDGEACAIAQECASQRCDLPAQNETCMMGTCEGSEPPHHLALGDACTVRAPIGWTPQACDEGTCDWRTDAPTYQTCVAFKAEGAICGPDSDCGPGFTCAPCTNGSGNCCTAGVAPGAACDHVACSLVGFACPNGSCEAVGDAGAACPHGDTECQQPLTCMNGQCQPGPGLGASCTGNAPCGDGGHCDGQHCVAALPEGENCRYGGLHTANWWCESGVCDAATGMCTARPVCL